MIIILSFFCLPFVSLTIFLTNIFFFIENLRWINWCNFSENWTGFFHKFQYAGSFLGLKKIRSIFKIKNPKWNLLQFQCFDLLSNQSVAVSSILAQAWADACYWVPLELIHNFLTSWKEIPHRSSNQIEPNRNLENIVPRTWKIKRGNKGNI